MDKKGFEDALSDRLDRAVGDVWSVDLYEVSGQEGSWSVGVQLEAHSPLGEDLVPVLNAEGADIDSVWDSLAADARSLYECFDPEENAAMWFENRDRVAGVPKSLRDLLDDGDQIKEMYEDLAIRITRG